MTPLTSLDAFRSITQYHPWHFWSLAGATGPVSVTKPSTNANNCRPVLRQYGWQAGDAVSRVQIAQALEEAEQLVRAQLNYPIAPLYATATMPWPTYYDRRLIQSAPISDGRWLSVELPDGKICAIGVETITLLATATVTYSDNDGDGLWDQAVLSLADSDTPLDEIQLYVSVDDRFDGTDRSERWRIHPAIATRSGAIVTIRLSAWQCVRPTLYEGALAGMLNGLEPTTQSNYMASMEVCRRRADPSGTTVATAQAKLIWETAPWPWCACPTSSDPAATAEAIARVGIRNADQGLVTPAEAVYDTTNQTWASADCWGWWGCRPPDRVEVRYLAGRPLVNQAVASPWDRLIVGMACAMLARPLAGCVDTTSIINRWQTDVTRAAGGETFQAQPRANNPFGARIGQIEAWTQTQHDRLTRGVQS
jgi:hypothetical protein